MQNKYLTDIYLAEFFSGKGTESMNSMFGPETKFFKVTNKIGNILLVSVLWLIGCIPVVTIGTSTIAMYYAMVKAVRCEEGYVSKEFIRSYRQNLKTGILLTVIFLVLAAVLWLDQSYTVKQISIMAGALKMVYLLLAFVIAGIVLYLFPVLSRFTMDAFSCFKLALFMVFKHLPTTILLLLIVAAGIVSALLIPVPMIFVMPGVCCYVGSFLMERILRKYMAKPETKEDEEKWYYR